LEKKAKKTSSWDKIAIFARYFGYKFTIHPIFTPMFNPIKLSFFLCLGLFPLSIFAQTDKISPALSQSWRNQPRQSCFILLRSQADSSAARDLTNKREKGLFVFQQLQKNATEQNPICEFLDRRGITYQRFWIANAIQTELDSSTALEIAHLATVARILPNNPIKNHQPVANPPARRSGNDTLTWGIERILAQKLWEKGVQGQGVTVGGQDTGYDWLHPAINSQYRGNRNGSTNHNYHWHDAIHQPHPLNSDSLNPCGYSISVPCDDGSHGTHTMGTMIGDKMDNTRIGVAPAAEWIGCRNMERGWGLPSTYIECFEWFAAPTDLSNQNPRPELAPHVINNSWGCPEIETCHPDNFEIMHIAVANLRAAGVMVVVSAGNDGPDCNSLANPAAIFAESFSVGASNEDDLVADFSSRGAVSSDSSFRTKPNVVAPGTNVLSSVTGGFFSNASGTSMAGPHVAGLVALLISADPTLAGDVDRITELLEQTANPLISQQICNGTSAADIPNNIFGYGRVNAWAALAVIRPDLLGNSINTEKIRLYPNPVKTDMVIIAPENMGAETTVSIYTQLGQTMWKQTANFERILSLNVEFLTTGTYYIEIKNGERRHTLPFQKL